MDTQIQRIRAALAAYNVPGSPISKADCLAEIQRIAGETKSSGTSGAMAYDYHNGPELGLEPNVPISTETRASPLAHTDDVAVDVFAAAMKQKLAAARIQGRGGWEQRDPAVLSQMLRAHVEKGDPCDVANFCCFLWVLGEPISTTLMAGEA
ncbi:hypothetical protein [Bordetella petrii]|uniref:Uncharacterized protein n=1 Tax=Bordetella petrii (strain ATCC BAA-461 / DSM 12804 / CCUG 43448 / CIP 107267 / Se-1111R) TaxID=340100 RepID=A9ID08_BORPD|nr:hypothetical protein [Bordetella petrii]CAP44743.1 conserved unknown protein [Bordetella petrii]